MSNNPSQRVVVRLQPAALVFVVLALVIGAMLMASNNIDPNSVKRAQFSPTPIDYFAAIKYSNWKSPDGVIQFDYPSTWTPEVDGSSAFSYLVTAEDVNIGPYLRIVMNRLDPGETLISLLQSNDSGTSGTAQPTSQVNPVEYAGMKGESKLETVQITDSLGQPLSRTVNSVLLSLDSAHLILVQSVSDTDDWLKMQPIADHVLNSLVIDKPTVIREIDGMIAAQEAAAGTPNAASAANAAATSAATSAAPSAATPAPTAATPAATAAAAGTKSF